MKPLSAWLLRLPIKGLASYDVMTRNEFTAHADDHDRSLGFLILRICLGVNIGMHGVSRLAAGPSSFSAQLLKEFHNTFLPAWSLQFFGESLPYIEAVIGLLILLGLKTRFALVSGALLIAILTFGSALVERWEIAGTQLVYAIAFAILLCLCKYDRFSVDSLLRSRRSTNR